MKYAWYTLLWLLCYAVPATAQESYIRDAVQRKFREKYMREHGDSGKAKFNAWADNVNDVKLRPRYSFNRSVTYATTDYRKGKPQKPRNMTMYANAKEQLSCMKGEGGKDEMYVVMDIVPRAQLMFNPEKKEVMVINANAFLSRKTQEAIDHPQPGKGDYRKPKEIGHKTILGYNCTGYLTENEQGEKISEMWVTKSADFVGFGLVNPALAGQEGMLVLQADHFRNGELTSSMVATAVNNDEHLVFESADYKVQQMPGLR